MANWLRQLFGKLLGKPEQLAVAVPTKGRPNGGVPVRRTASTGPSLGGAKGALALEAAAARRKSASDEVTSTQHSERIPDRGEFDEDEDSIPLRAPGGRGIGAPRSASGRMQSRNPGQSGEKPRAPNEVESLAIDEFSGRVETAPGGAVPLNLRQRSVVALLDNGTLLVAASSYGEAAVSSARALLQKGGFEPSQVFLVEMEVIRNIYEGYMKNHGGVGVVRDTAQMQRVVLDLVRIAAQQKCSDIHIAIGRHEAHIRVRSDGVMMHLKDLAAGSAHELLQAAFAMADVSDSSYRLLEPQGARITSFRTTLPEGVQALRLQYNPQPDGGRHCVIRLLYAQRRATHQDVDDLGYAKHHVDQIKLMREKPYGINVISGPTGSGKSTTLQTSLQATVREKQNEVNVITVEDPPEYEIKGAVQLPVMNVKTEEERKEAFQQAINAALRSDPDIVMIGEIRDPASAQLAFQAATTGHQVWASLHANNALAIIDRLRDMHVELWKLSDHSLVTGLVGQRLVRKLCGNCKLPYRVAIECNAIDAAEDKLLVRIFGSELVADKLRFAKPDGCDTCRNGYLGRSVVAETILPDEKFMSFIAADRKSDAITYWLEHLEGMTMVEHGLMKVANGEVDAKEIRYKVGVISSVDPGRIRKLLAGQFDTVEAS